MSSAALLGPSSTVANILGGSSMATAEATLPMGKALASTEKKVRDGAIRSLSAYLAQTGVGPLPDVEMAKLWKGIFYCFWMSDKPRVQQALAQEMADMLLIINAGQISASSSSSSAATNAEPSLLFLEGFWDAMVREWWGLDKWRIDKFMMLVRRFVNAAFRLLDRTGWDETAVKRFTGMLMKDGGVLRANDVKTPDGLMYHVCDIYLEELDKAVAQRDADAERQKAERVYVPATMLLQPFFETVARCHAAHHFDRMMKAVVMPYLDDCLLRTEEQKAQSHRSTKRQRRQDVADEQVEERESACEFPSLLRQAGKAPDLLRKEAFAKLFAAASQPTSVEARRRRIYKLCKDEEERLEEEEDGD